MQNKENEKNNFYKDHTLIIHELERSIKIYNWDFILSFLPAGSFLVGGYNKRYYSWKNECRS